MIEVLLGAFIAGVLVKRVDDWEDRKGKKTPVRFLVAMGYGALIGYLISAAPFSMLFLGALAAQVFAGKIDAFSHQLAGIAAIGTLGYYGLPPLDLGLFLFFFLFAYVDEMVLVKPWNVWTENRVFLKAATVPLALLGHWEFLVAILLFDGGYVLVDKVANVKNAAR